MNCLKCGKETNTEQVFCADCLQTMDAQPVPPGTPVMLYPREVTPEKPSRSKRFSYADLIRKQRRAIRWLAGVLGAVFLLLTLSCLLLWQAWEQIRLLETPTPVIGQNYTAETD